MYLIDYLIVYRKYTYYWIRTKLDNNAAIGLNSPGATSRQPLSSQKKLPESEYLGKL